MTRGQLHIFWRGRSKVLFGMPLVASPQYLGNGIIQVFQAFMVFPSFYLYLHWFSRKAFIFLLGICKRIDGKRFRLWGTSETINKNLLDTPCAMFSNVSNSTLLLGSNNCPRMLRQNCLPCSKGHLCLEINSEPGKYLPNQSFPRENIRFEEPSVKRS